MVTLKKGQIIYKVKIIFLRFFYVCEQLLEALVVIHGNLLIHRDIKPANCLLSADFRFFVLFFLFLYFVFFVPIWMS